MDTREHHVQVPGPVCPVPCCHQSRARASAYLDSDDESISTEGGHGADAVLLRELDRYDNTGFKSHVILKPSRSTSTFLLAKTIKNQYGAFFVGHIFSVLWFNE